MSYVYRFDNSEKEVIYIGRTVDIRNRIDRNHLSGNSHLPERAIREINKIYIASLNNNDEAIIYENYLINTLNPKYNSQNKNNSKFSFKLPDVEWVLYKTIGNHDKKKRGIDK